MKKTLVSVISVLLILAMAWTMVACGGKTAFTVITVDLEGNETVFEIKTKAATVGEALLAEGLIAGEQGDYGLYIKTVNGLTLDWDKDGKYWAVYVNGEYAMSGVDTIAPESGAVYTFQPE